MISTKVNMEIKDIHPRILGKLTIRWMVCIIFMVIISSISLYVSLHIVGGESGKNLLSWLLMLNVPLGLLGSDDFVGTGMPFEKFIKVVFKYYAGDNRLVYTTDNFYEEADDEIYSAEYIESKKIIDEAGIKVSEKKNKGYIAAIVCAVAFMGSMFAYRCYVDYVFKDIFSVVAVESDVPETKIKAEDIEKICETVSFNDKKVLVNMVTDNVTMEELGTIKNMANDGLTDGELEQAKLLAKDVLSDEDMIKAKELYSVYVSNYYKEGE